MITINDKLFITKEVNEIVIDFAKQIVLRKLLLKFSFDANVKKKEISDLIVNVNFHNENIKKSNLQVELKSLITSFLTSCNSKEIHALYFWLIDRKYMYYFQKQLREEDDYCDETFDHDFGRELAYKLYQPEASGLDNELKNELKNFLICFASEFDFSLITKNQVNEILEEMNSSRYCG